MLVFCHFFLFYMFWIRELQRDYFLDKFKTSNFMPLIPQLHIYIDYIPAKGRTDPSPPSKDVGLPLKGGFTKSVKYRTTMCTVYPLGLKGSPFSGLSIAPPELRRIFENWAKMFWNERFFTLLFWWLLLEGLLLKIKVDCLTIRYWFLLSLKIEFWGAINVFQKCQEEPRGWCRRKPWKWWPL